MPTPLRLVDLHCDWLLQYVGETTDFPPVYYPEIVANRGKPNSYLSQADGYLQGASASILACYRRVEDWKHQPDPWKALDDLIARIEAEFPGRILIESADLDRWRHEPEGLCWAIIGVEGFDFLVRTSSDLERLPRLFERGVRVFQPVYSADNHLAGSSEAGDDRGLLELGRDFLQTLADLAEPETGPRPVLDLSHLNPASCGQVLAWYEADFSRAESLLPIYSHGAVEHEGLNSPRALSRENLKRLRALGGTLGFTPAPQFYADIDTFKETIESAAEIPFLGTPGYAGLAIGSDFLGVQNTLPQLGNSESITAWFSAQFPPDAARKILTENAEQLIQRSAF